MLKYLNQTKTIAKFFDTSFQLSAPEDWDSISDGPTKEKVKAWLAAGNTPEPSDPDPPPTQDELDASEARQYAKLVALRGMTPAQVSTWVDGNIVDLQSARDAIKTLEIAVSILARRI